MRVDPDPCPHHDAVNLAQYGAAAQDAHGHDIAQMQGYPQSANQDQHEHGPCNCVGSCDSGGAPPMIAAAPEVTIAVAPASEITPPPVHREIVPAKDEGWTPYLPQAPPLPVLSPSEGSASVGPPVSSAAGMASFQPGGTRTRVSAWIATL